MKIQERNTHTMLLPQAGGLWQKKGILLGRKGDKKSATQKLQQTRIPRPLRGTSSKDRKEVSRYVSRYIRELLTRLEQQVDMLVVFYTAPVI